MAIIFTLKEIFRAQFHIKQQKPICFFSTSEVLPIQTKQHSKQKIMYYAGM